MNKLIITFILLFLLAGCARPTPAPTSAVEPEETPIPTIESAPETETAEVPQSNILSPENVTGLTPWALGLPEYPIRLIWPAADAALPDSPEQRPDLLLEGESGLHPVMVSPAGLGFPLSRPGVPGQVIAAAPDGRSLVARAEGNFQASLYTWRGDLLRSFDQPAQAYTASYSADGRWLAIGSAEERAVFLYDLETSSTEGGPVARLSGFETAAPIYQAEVAPGGEVIAWIARATLQFQRVESGEMSGQLNFIDFIGPVAFSPDGQRLALSVLGRLEIYSVPGGELLQGITLGEALPSLAFSPDGSLLAGAYGNSIQIWDGETLSPLAHLEAGGPASHVAFSPDGETLVSVQESSAEDVPLNLKIWRLP